MSPYSTILIDPPRDGQESQTLVGGFLWFIYEASTSFIQSTNTLKCLHVPVSVLSWVCLFATPWIIAHPSILAWEIPWTGKLGRL